MDKSTVVRRNPSLLFSVLDEDTVFFSADRGQYYGTQAVGSHIWALIEEEMSISSICDKLLEHFSVDQETCEREVSCFMKQLEMEGLIMIR
ncbi:PqqD family peptide modification chaperone [Halomonas nitroreducens]|uniref:PqqD family protein n=1 Tax=Halomonas nitroreducens TaxID=447425 RepID=A0A431V4S1_9GAMM|nr:PqqD family peptide modification chaperone [Halomonas nitroreducens]RTR05379.1 PqqD family protein [Halomonas nitroreducens]